MKKKIAGFIIQNTILVFGVFFALFTFVSNLFILPVLLSEESTDTAIQREIFVSLFSGLLFGIFMRYFTNNKLRSKKQ